MTKHAKTNVEILAESGFEVFLGASWVNLDKASKWLMLANFSHFFALFQASGGILAFFIKFLGFGIVF